MVDVRTREAVHRRAGGACEYCSLPEDTRAHSRFQVEHIIARKHGGGDVLENLALACDRLSKGTNLTGIDPLTGLTTALFNPREQRWEEHFELVGPYIVGRTAIGRTTVRVLNMNEPGRLPLRESGM